MLKNNDIRQRISNKCLLGHKTHLGFLTGCTVFHPHFGKGKVLGYSEEGDLVTLRMEGNKEIGMPPEELLEPGFEWSDERNLLTRTISHLSSLSRW